MTSSHPPSLQATIHQVKGLLHQAKNICVLTGAGVSAESGIPTFRDKQTGLWEQYRAEDLANIAAFERDPKMVWSWYQWRRDMVADKKPNLTHFALAQLQTWADTEHKHFTLITQNVDDLHEQAGSEAAHLHGHLWQNKCSECDTPYTDTVKYTNDSLLYCQHCGGIIRPDIVWFGEALPVDAWTLAENAARHCDVLMSIGTSSLVYPAAGLADMAKKSGAHIIEINLNPTNSPFIDIVVAGKAGEILPALVNQLSAV